MPKKATLKKDARKGNNGKPAVKIYASLEKRKLPKFEVLTRPIPSLPPPPRNGEISVEFNKYNLVYSNNFEENLSSEWRAGVTGIDCYKDSNFVGSISFYETAENMGGGYVDGNGVVVVEYPIEEFENVLRLLKTFTNLYLLLVERDVDGTPFTHKVGAVMTFQMKSIGS